MNNLMQELDVVIKKYLDDRIQVDVNYRESFIRKLSEKADALKERAQGNETVAVRDANRIATLEWKLNTALESIDTLNARVSELQDDSGAENNEALIEDMVGRLVDEAVSNLTFTTTAGY